jgi:hypothetical protein
MTGFRFVAALHTPIIHMEALHSEDRYTVRCACVRQDVYGRDQIRLSVAEGTCTRHCMEEFKQQRADAFTHISYPETHRVCRTADGTAQADPIRTRRRRTRGSLHPRNVTAVLIFVLIVIVLSMIYLQGLRSIQNAVQDGSDGHRSPVESVGGRQPHVSRSPNTLPGHLRQQQLVVDDRKGRQRRNSQRHGHQPPG